MYKHYTKNFHTPEGYVSKLLLIMKLTTFIVLISLMQVSAATFGQKVTLKQKGISIDKVFIEIQKQTGYGVVFKTEGLDMSKKLNADFNKVELDIVLTRILEGTNLVFELEDQNIIITKEKSFFDRVKDAFKAIDVSGRVTSEDGQPLGGATVFVKGESASTSTDAKGYFLLKNVSPEAVLVVTYLGFEKAELKAASNVQVKLKLSSNPLDEVKVIAYGNTSQRLATGNIALVKGEDIQKHAVQNPLLALQGRVPGLTVVQNSGTNGGGLTVRIQGRNNISVSSGSDPLFVVDGVPYPSQMLSTFTGGPLGPILGNSGGPAGSGGGNPLNYLNTNDIESISVLKDADATAIYGSRAANGAILITTKKGKIGDVRIDIHVQTGWGNVIENLNTLNTQQYVQMRKEAFKNDNATPTIANAPDLLVWDTISYTNWQKKLIGNTARYMQTSANISGGTSNIQYIIGGTFNRHTTVFLGDFNDKKSSLHFNVNGNSANKKFNIQLTGSYLLDDNRLPTADFTSAALFLAPNAPALLNPDGSLNWAPNSTGTSTWSNPLASTLSSYNNKVTNLITNLNIGYRISDKLDFRTSMGYTNLIGREYTGFPSAAASPENRPTYSRFAWFTNSAIDSWIIEPQLNYKNSFRFGKIDWLLGGTFQKRNSEGQSLQTSGFNSDQVMKDIFSATSIQANGSDNSIYKYNGLFARLNYNWREKYILNFSFRRDGSSRFGNSHQFHDFWGIGTAWIFTDEHIFENNKILSFGKLKLSYGITGSDQIGDYRFLNLYRANTPGISYQGTNGVEPVGLPNANISWEETKKMQAGIELGFFDRINVAATYVRNETSNQLLNYVLPTTTGFADIIQNFPAKVRNTAWEFSFDSANLKSDEFSWFSSINITVPKNEVVDFPNYSSSTYASGSLGVIPGQPLGVIKAYKYLGVQASSGIYLFEDRNGNPVTNPVAADQKVFIDQSPKFYGGINNRLKLKNLELDIFFQFTKQDGRNIPFNGNPPGRFTLGNGNQPSSVVDRWRRAGDITNVSKYSQNASLVSSYVLYLSNSDYYYGDASYLRLKNISLSWNLPYFSHRNLVVKSLKVQASGQNLLTITSYKGLDPETLSSTALPPLRILTVGIKAEL